MGSPSGLVRLINLSDAVVAIAITLLVLPLVDRAAVHNTTSISSLLSHNGGRIFAFVLSFFVISRFWLIHHALFLNVIGLNNLLMSFNFVWLLGIVFLPFPTELVAAGGVTDPVAANVYIGTLLVTSVANELSLLAIIHSPELQATTVRGTLTALSATLACGGMALAFVVSVALPSVGMWALVVLLPLGLTRRLLPERHHNRPPRSA